MLKEGRIIGRPKKDEEHKKRPVKFYVLPSYIPIIKNVIKNLDENQAVNYIVPKKEEPVVAPVEEPAVETIDENKPIKKSDFGISVNDFLKKVGKDPIVEIKEDDQDEKDYTAWQKDNYMCQVDKGIMYEPDPYGYPDEALEVQRKYKDLWVKCYSAKQNKNNALYNEYMTELYERIQNG